MTVLATLSESWLYGCAGGAATAAVLPRPRCCRGACAAAACCSTGGGRASAELWACGAPLGTPGWQETHVGSYIFVRLGAQHLYVLRLV